MLRTTPDGLREIGLLQFPECPGRGLQSWATVDASAFETPVRTADGRPLRVEFVAAADATLTRFGDAVASCAFQIAPTIAVRPGTVYRDAVRRFYPDATTPHLFSMAPFAWGLDVESFSDEDVYVTWLQLVPITDDEAAYAAERGPVALESAYVQAQTDLFSITREGVRLDS